MSVYVVSNCMSVLCTSFLSLLLPSLPSLPHTHMPHSAKDVSVILSHLSTHISYLKGTASLLSRQMEANPTLIDPSQVGGSRVLTATISACTIASNTANMLKLLVTNWP